MTLTGDLLGTLRYMAPEQALGKRAAVGHRADVYSLGMTLYELLALRPAFAGHEREELLRQIAFDEPRPLRKIDCAIPADLDVIVRKAVNKSAGDRYASAQELADDLERFLERKTIRARPPGVLERTTKWARRRPAAAALAAVSILAVAALWAGTLWHARTLAAALHESELHRRQAETNEQRAIEREESLKQNQYAVSVKQASEALKSGNLASALQLLSPYQENAQEAHRRGFEWSYLWDQLHHSDLATLKGHTKQVNMVGYSSDDKLLVSASDDGTVRVWDGQTHKLITTLAGHSKCVNEFAFAPDDRWLATASCDGTVKIWDMSTLQEKETFIDLGEPVWCVAVSPDGKTIATGSGSAPDPNNGTRLIIWDVEKHSRIREPAAKDLRVASVAFSPDGTNIVTAGGNFVRVWSTENGRELANAAHFGANCVRYSRDGSIFVSAGIASAPTVVLWEPPLGLKTVFRPQFRANSVAISDDNSLVAAGTNGSTIELWDTTTASRRGFLYGHRDWLRAIAFRHDGRRLVTGGNGNASSPFVKVWDVTKEPGLECHVKLPSRNIQSVEFDQSFTKIAVRDADSVIRLWNFATEQVERSLGTERSDHFFSGANHACFSQNGIYVAASSFDGEVDVWDVSSGNRVAALRSTLGDVFNLRFSVDGRRLIGLVSPPIPNGSGTVGVIAWDVSNWTLREEKTLVHLTGSDGVQTAAVHPYGDIVAVGTAKAIMLYSLSTGQLLASLDARYAWKSKLDFFADGDLLICGVNDGYAILWDWRKGVELRRFVGNSGSVHAFTLSPDGKTLAMGDGEGIVRFWDPHSGQELLRLETAASDVAALQFSADGKRLACWNRETGFSGSSEIRIWSIERRWAVAEGAW